jgi:hypothetical protein
MPACSVALPCSLLAPETNPSAATVLARAFHPIVKKHNENVAGATTYLRTMVPAQRTTYSRNSEIGKARWRALQSLQISGVPNQLSLLHTHGLIIVHIDEEGPPCKSNKTSSQYRQSRTTSKQKMQHETDQY